MKLYFLLPLVLSLLCDINVKKTTVYTHVNGDRPSHIENSKNKKVILLYHCILSYVNVQQYSKITFLFLLFSMSEGLSPLICAGAET